VPDINDALVAGISPLHFAAYGGNLDCLVHLVDAGAILEEKTSEGWSALMMSAQEGHFGMTAFYNLLGPTFHTRLSILLLPRRLRCVSS